MRIAMVSSARYPPQEGIGFHTYQLARHLTRSGHDVTLITRGGLKGNGRDEIGGIRILRFPFIPAYPFHVHIHGAFVRRDLRRRADEYDLIHVHSPLPAIPPAVLPIVTTVHTPMLTDTHSIPLNTPRGALIRAQGVISQRIERRLFERSNVIISVASSVSAELAPYGVDPRAVPALGNGVDHEVFTPGPPSQRDPTILYVGRLGDRKGLEDLVRALPIVRNEYSEAQLVLVGKGPLDDMLRRLSVDLGVADRVKFLGHIDMAHQDDLVECYRRAAVYVQPSHYEGLPTALLEAMACACPCVATVVGGHPEIVVDGNTGLLVPSHSPQELAAAVIKLMRDRVLAERLGASGRRRVLSRFTWDAISRAHVEIYHLARDRFTEGLHAS